MKKKKNHSNLMTQISNYLKGSPEVDGSVLGKELYASNDTTVIRNGIFPRMNTALFFLVLNPGVLHRATAAIEL